MSNRSELKERHFKTPDPWRSGSRYVGVLRGELNMTMNRQFKFLTDMPQLVEFWIVKILHRQYVIAWEMNALETCILCPFDFQNCGVKIIEKHLCETGSTLGSFTAELGQPSIVGLKTCKPILKLDGVPGTSGTPDPRREERRGRVRKQHFRGDPLCIDASETCVAVPIQIGAE